MFVLQFHHVVEDGNCGSSDCCIQTKSTIREREGGEEHNQRERGGGGRAQSERERGGGGYCTCVRYEADFQEGTNHCRDVASLEMAENSPLGNH